MELIQVSLNMIFVEFGGSVFFFVATKISPKCEKKKFSKEYSFKGSLIFFFLNRPKKRVEVLSWFRQI